MPPVEPKVAYSQTKGIYLGLVKNEPAWSFDQGLTGDEQAPLFDNQHDLDQHKARTANGVPWPEDVELHMVLVVPASNRFATVEECANAGLPRWGRTKER